MNIQRLFITAAFLVVFFLFGASQAHAGALAPPSFEPEPAVAVCLDGGDTALNGSVKGLSKGKKKRAYDVDLKLFKESSQAHTDSTTASNRKPEFSFDVSGLDEGKYLGVVTVT
ncbi:MAG TPA: hypothetical protein VK054_06155, partial [Beutenbergiaceae bacterium]|nr:hypothetical protein [Beutenbergiaceae bacterium]